MLSLLAYKGNAQEAPPALNRVLDLDGKDGAVELPSRAFNHLRDVTIEGWIKFDSTKRYSRFFDFGFEGKAVFVCNVFEGGTLWFFPLTPAHQTAPQTAHVIVTNEWRHIAVVMGSSGMALYLNGVRLASRTNTTPFNELNAGERNFLGRSNFRAPPFNDSDLHGQMDEVRIWNKARTQSEIQETLFKQLTGKEAGLVGLWNFNDGTARDASTNGFHGQILGNARILEADYPASRNGRAFPTVLSGVVTDPLNNPVEGAMILIENPGISTNVIRSDPRGEFGLTLFENGDRFRISATQGDHGFHPTDFELVRGREHALSLKLVYAVSLSGRVLAMDGSPQLNVPVQAFGLVGNSNRVATTHSDKEGHYQFVNLAPGPYRIQCQTLSGMISSSAGDEVVVMDGRTIRNVDLRFMPETRGFLKQFTRMDGLADDVVNCLWIDADDMLWLGTAHGLSRFDGKQFENFTDEDGLNDPVVQALHRDAAGVLWIGTQRGITLLGPGPKSTNSIFQKGIP